MPTYAVASDVQATIKDGSAWAPQPAMHDEAYADINDFLRDRLGDLTETTIAAKLAEANVVRVLRKAEVYHVLWHWFLGSPLDAAWADAARMYAALYSEELNKLPKADVSQTGLLVSVSTGRLELQ